MTVADAVIGSECNCDDGTRDHAAVDNPGPGEDLAETDDGNLRRIDDPLQRFDPAFAKA